ncbi:MAG: ribonuclease P protein component [Actinobacteria bacterium]|nr:ribonuclease P protein component [Actinomycetota bacterium]MCG2801214.1 ribonuclease P protein component [Cellulomonas sp.]
MLPSEHRMRRSADFTRTVRDGARAGRRSLVVHVARGAGAGPVVGFVVPKSVGGAVARNRVKRRLRALVRARLDSFATDESLVVRALPAAAGTSFEVLGADLEGALHTARRRADSSHG